MWEIIPRVGMALKAISPGLIPQRSCSENSKEKACSMGRAIKKVELNSWLPVLAF